MKKVSILLFGLLSAPMVFSQDAATKGFWSDPLHHHMAPLYLVSAFVIIVIVLVITVAVILLQAINTLIEQTEREKAKAKACGGQLAPRKSFWSRFGQTQAIVLAEKEGVRNHLRPLGKWLFYGITGSSLIYLIVIALLPLSQEELENDSDRVEELIHKTDKPKVAIDVENLQYKADLEILAKGKSVFIVNCGSCHRNDGGGNMIGPNLTDSYWLHGGDIKKVFSTINNGVVEKGMPAWGKSLSATDVRDVAFFVMSLQGSSPPDAKLPQGELVKQTDQKSDSLKVTAAL